MSKKNYLTLTFRFIFKREKMQESRIHWYTPEIANQVIDVLRGDKVIIAPSDTVFGLFTRTNRIGFEKLNMLKNRKNKPCLILIENFSDAGQFIDIADKPKIMAFLKEVWPGAVTVILPAKEGIESFLQSSSGAIALRLPVHEQLTYVMRHVGPLFSTSANKAGQPIPATCDEIDNELLDHADLVICDDSERKKKNVKSSTIVDCTLQKPVIVRRGSDVVRVERLIDDLWQN